VSLLGSVLSLVREEVITSGGHEVVDFRPSESVGVASGLAAVASALKSSVEAAASGLVTHGAGEE